MDNSDKEMIEKIDLEFKKSLINKIRVLTSNAIKKHQRYKNLPELCAVLKEEIEETQEEFEKINKLYDVIWKKNRKDQDVEDELVSINKYCKRAIEEIIDVMVVCNKARLKYKDQCIICGSIENVEENQGFYYCLNCEKKGRLLL